MKYQKLTPLGCEEARNQLQLKNEAVGGNLTIFRQLQVLNNLMKGLNSMNCLNSEIVMDAF